MNKIYQLGVYTTSGATPDNNKPIESKTMKQYVKRWAAMAVMAFGVVAAQANAANIAVNLNAAGINVVVLDDNDACNHQHRNLHEKKHVKHDKHRMEMEKRRQAMERERRRKEMERNRMAARKHDKGKRR